mmetsp:Transcript_55216/g.87549  ORF Transcript_55216/g.87549 Transcript_55216/m.87549 type:complete len:772 (+) Transcript_55216:93-2408(+)
MEIVPPPSAERLRYEFQRVGLTKFDDATLEYFASSMGDLYDNKKKLYDDEAIAEVWSPFIVDSSDQHGEDSATKVCIEVLRHLKSIDTSTSCTGSSSERSLASVPSATSKSTPILTEVPGLREWLVKLHLEKYYDDALKWCQEMGAADVSEVKEDWEDFRDSLPLRPLEKKRIEKACAESPQAKGTSKLDDEPPPSPIKPDVAGGHEEKQSPFSPIQEKTPVEQDSEGLHQFGGNTFNEERYSYDPVNDKLGAGATADVFRCRRLEKGQMRQYAVKCVRLHKLKFKPDFVQIRERMCRETQILFKLRHRNVVSLYDVVTEDDQYYLVMDLVEGGDLFARIPIQMGMDELKARYVLWQLVPALQYIHEQNVVHRDLKPENILVDEKASKGGHLFVKITDFGHSKSIDDDSLALTKVGTSQYWAPEVAASNGQRVYDATVDLWSLGVTLYLMLEGNFPFQNDVQHQQARFSFKEDTHDRPSISDEAQTLISKLITVSPKDRISLEGCMADPWTRRGLLDSLAGNMNSTQESSEGVEKFPVVGESCKGYKVLRSDLVLFSEKNSCSAEQRRQGEYREVVVTWSRSVTVEQKQDSREALWKLLDYHFPSRWREAGAHATGREREDDSKSAWRGKGSKEAKTADYSSGKTKGKGKTNTCELGNQSSLPTTSQSTREGFSTSMTSRNGFRLLNSILRVDKDIGAGLDLIPEEGKGMKVEAVSASPGQPTLQRGDIIQKISQVSLAGKTDHEITTIFSEYFEDGASIQIKRVTKGGLR